MKSSTPPHAPTTKPGTLAATVRSLPLGVRPSDVWRGAAFALLRLNAKEAEALAQLFEDENATDETRQHVLDLLAGAGTFETQVIMRRLLALAVARRNNRAFASFVQRLAILEQPDGPTLRFLMSVFAESKHEPHDVRAACAYALGASAGQAFLAGDADAAVRACDVLRRELLSAGAAPEKCALVAALGNAGLPGDAGAILRFTDDSDVAVRAAAAFALRKIGTKETRAKLIAMLADRDLKVAQSALASLADHKLGDEELDQVSELVLGGRTALALDDRILRLVVAQRPRVASTPSRPGAVENALRLLLGRIEASSPAALGPTQSGERRAAVAPPPPVRPPVPRAAGPSRAPPARAPSSHPPPTLPRDNPLAWQPPLAPPVRASQVPTAPPPPPNGAPSAFPTRPFSGQYRLVPGEDEHAKRLEQLGLNPKARTSILPPPPPRRVAPPPNVVARRAR